MFKIGDQFKLRYSVGEFGFIVFIEVLEVLDDYCRVKSWDKNKEGEIFHEYETNLSFEAIKEKYEKIQM